MTSFSQGPQDAVELRVLQTSVTGGSWQRDHTCGTPQLPHLAHTEVTMAGQQNTA